MEANIPGFSSNTGIDTNKLITDLVNAERQPIIRTENNIQISQTRIQIWRETNSKISLLQDSAKKLYSFNSPFREKTVTSSHQDLVTAQATRIAANGTYNIKINRLAQADRWLSQPISSDYQVPKGTYTFNIGEEQVEFNFAGNTIEELTEQINSKGKNKIKASYFNRGVNDKENVMLLEGLLPGAAGKIVLKNVAEQLALDVKLIGTDTASTQYVQLATKNISNYISQEHLFANTVPTKKNNKVTSSIKLLSGAAGTLQANVSQYADILSETNASVVFEISAVQRVDMAGNATGVGDKSVVAGVENLTEKKFSVQLEETLVYGEKMKQLVDNTTRTSQNQDALSLIFNKDLQTVYALSSNDIQQNQTIRIPIALRDFKSLNNVLEFTLVNPFPQYDLIVESLSLTNNAGTSDLVPLQAVSKSQNAAVEFNGIQLERSSNTITDIIPGISLNLKKADTEQYVDILVESNVQAIKDDIITFVGAYNQVVRLIEIYTYNTYSKKDPDGFLNSIEFQSEAERITAKQNLGVLSSELILSRLLTSMQSTLLSVYNNQIDPNINSLRAIGIASNLTNDTAPLRTRKYLDIDETKLDKAIADNPDALAVLFGTDTNNDIIIDYGVAFRIAETIIPYSQANGIISQKQSTLKTQVEQYQKDLEKYNAKLVRYEQELRRKFGNMEQIINGLNSSSSAINSFTQQNNNNNNN